MKATNTIYSDTLALDLFNHDGNRTDCERFLGALLHTDSPATEPVTFQVFNDRDPGLGIARNFKGTLNEHWETLLRYNEEGMGIFVTINECDDRGRKAQNVTRVRAVFVDLDVAPLQPVEDFAISPNIIVESSPGRFHAYWSIKDCSLEQFSGFQRRLACLFNGDPAVHDLPRVMRLPGFVHQKNTPHLTRVRRAEPAIYEIGQLEQHLPPAPESQSDPHTKQSGTSTPIEEIEEMLSALPADNYDDWVTTGMAIHSQYPGEEGLALFRKWSASSKKYTPGEPERKWSSFKGANSKKSITLGTLRKRATEHGYQPSAETLSYQDYINFAVEKLGEIKMDILTNELMVSKRGGGWEPLLNNLPYLESYAVEDRRRFMLSTFPRHFARLAKEDLRPELLVALPTWDGVDRLMEICQVIRCTHFSSSQLYELLRHWLVGMFRRLEDPTLQNPMIILKGAQGVGKDTLISALLGGLGEYLKELDISSREAEAQLHMGVAFKVSEFDRAARTNVATLKHLLTVSSTHCRLPYDRRPQNRMVRASFASSCNVDDILRDTTGNRRYWIIELSYGGFAAKTVDPEPGQSGHVSYFAKTPDATYPGMFCRPNYRAEQLQILAQAQALAQHDTCDISPETKAIMEGLIAKMTPDDPEKEAEELWHERLTDYVPQASLRVKGPRHWISNADLRDSKILEEISAMVGLTIHRIRSMLKRRGLMLKTHNGRGYLYHPRIPKQPAPRPPLNDDDLDLDE